MAGPLAMLMHQALLDGAGFNHPLDAWLAPPRWPAAASTGRKRTSSARAAAPAVQGVHVTETAEGYLLTANAPGVAASDVSVEVATTGGPAPQRVLTVTCRAPAASAPKGTSAAAAEGGGAEAGSGKAGDNKKQAAGTVRFRRSWQLEDDADVEHIEASCVHGLLRVAVPRMGPVVRSLPVAAQHPEDDAAADAAGGDAGREAAAADADSHYLITESVPGLRAADIRAELVTSRLPGRPAELRLSAARNRWGAALASTYRLPPDADVGSPAAVEAATEAPAVRVSCADGLLRAVVRRRRPAEAQLAVAVAQAYGEDEGEVLARVALPEFAAEHVSAKLCADGAVLRLHARKQEAGALSEVHRVLRLERPVRDAAAARVAVADGLFELRAPEAALRPPKEQEALSAAVAVSGTKHAKLLLPAAGAAAAESEHAAADDGPAQLPRLAPGEAAPADGGEAAAA